MGKRKKMKISAFPILKLLIPYVIGIFSGYFFPFCHLNPLFCLAGIILCLVISIIFNAKMGFYRQKVAASSLLTAAFLIGFTHVFLLFHYRYDSALRQFDGENRCWQVQLTEPAQVREKSVKCIGSLYDVQNRRHLVGETLLYLERDSLSAALQCGDFLSLYAQLSPIAEPENPYSFDYKTFMKRKGIYFTGYASGESWQRQEIGKQGHIKRVAYRWQQKLSQILADAGLQDDEYAIAAAILLGNDETMEPELKSAYSSAGVSHILCVSGMHVGIVFMIINYLLMPLERSRALRYLRSFLLFLIIWGYANITGLSPSVSRAAAMFTFVLIGNHLRRNTNVFHSLFASLFILLSINPLLIFELGFQLSYLAVVGIVLLQPPIYNLFKIKLKIVNYFWNLASVSIAAQIATFPLTICYFGTFPNYFLVANLSVIALSFIVVVTGVSVLAFSFVPFLLKYLGKLLTLEIKVMNRIIFWVENLPYSVTENLSISHLQMILLYGAIIFLFLFHLKKKPWKITVALSTLVIFLILWIIDTSDCRNEKSFTLYAANRSTALSINANGRNLLFCDSVLLADEKGRTFAVANHERKRKMKTEIVPIDSCFQTDEVTKQRNFIRFAGKTIYLHSAKETLYATELKPKVDFVVIRNNARQPLDEILEALEIGYVIIDKSNSRWYEQRWREACDEAKIPYHSISESGHYFQFKIGEE